MGDKKYQYWQQRRFLRHNRILYTGHTSSQSSWALYEEVPGGATIDKSKGVGGLLNLGSML